VTVCAKCVIGGILQNGSGFSFDEAADAETDAVPLSLEFYCELDTDEEESRGQRKISFDGRVSEGTVVDGTIEGTLFGQFDVLTDKEISAPATVETFSRRGLLAFLTVSVRDDAGRTYFSANIRPPVKFVDPRRLTELHGTVFLGWEDQKRALSD
jgi:hypothetical protein